MGLTRTLFSTDGIALRERHAFWRAQSTPSVGRLIEAVAEPGFSADAMTITLGSLWLIVGRYGAQRVERTPELIRRTPVDHLHLTIPLDAFVQMDAGTVAPGAAMFIDLSLPWRHRAERCSMALIAIPRGVMIERGIDPRALHGVVVPPDATMMLREHILWIKNRAGELPAETSELLGRTIVDLIAIMLLVRGFDVDPSPIDARDALLSRAQHLIADGLKEPWLDTGYLVAALGISRSRLYRLFANNGGVQRYILRQRLAVAKAALADDGATIKRVAADLQFLDTSHFSRRFSAEFDLSPTAWRRTLKNGAGI